MLPLRGIERCLRVSGMSGDQSRFSTEKVGGSVGGTVGGVITGERQTRLIQRFGINAVGHHTRRVCAMSGCFAGRDGRSGRSSIELLTCVLVRP
jgi:hypothetical protein